MTKVGNAGPMAADLRGASGEHRLRTDAPARVKHPADRVKRRFVGVRLSPNGLAVVDRLAQREGVKRSEMIRRLLAEAVTARRAT